MVAETLAQQLPAFCENLGKSATTPLVIRTLVGPRAATGTPYAITVTATDEATNLSTSQTFNWTITTSTAAPVWTAPGDQSNADGDDVDLQLSASDANEDALTYTASGLPPGLTLDPIAGAITGTLPTGMSINPTTGLISGTLASSDASDTPYSVTVTANDGTSSSSQTFLWTISVVSIAQTIDQSNLDGDVVALSLTTAYHGGGTLSYSATGLPPALSIAATTGRISGTLASTADTNSPYSVTVTATDGTNTASDSFNLTIIPHVSLDAIDDQSNLVGDVVSLQTSATLNDTNSLSYSATGLPTGLTINGTTGLISGTIRGYTGSPYTVTVTATDKTGIFGTIVGTSSQTFTWTIPALSLLNPGALRSLNGATISLPLQGHDADGDTLTYTASGLPSGLSLNASTGLISGTLASDADLNSPYSVTVTVSDGTNNVSQTFLWSVGQITLSAPSDQTTTEGGAVSLQLQGAALNGPLTYSANGLPDGLSLNATTGLISGTIAAGAAANGPFTVDVAASNGVVSVSQTFAWNVNPVVTLTPVADQSNVEGNAVNLQVKASDSKSASLTFSAVGLPAGLRITTVHPLFGSPYGTISGTIAAGDASAGPYTVTVTASDGTYSSSQTFTWNITHTDTATPTMTNPGTQTNVPGDSVNVQVNANDPDGDTLTYSATGLPDGLDIDPFSGIISGTVADDAISSTPYAVTVTADDGNGKTVTQTFDWTINDTSLSVQASPTNVTTGSDSGSLTLATFTTPDLNTQAGEFAATVDWGDGNSDTGVISGDNGSFTVTGNHSYAVTGAYPVTVTLTDSAGNSTTTTSTATVTDAPLTLTGGFQVGAIQQQSTNVTLATFTDGNPDALPSDFTATIDWGDGSVTTTGTVVAGANGLFTVNGGHSYSQNGTYTATITVTDAGGALATATSTVAVGDVYAGTQSILNVANFTDSDVGTTSSNYTATIDWGDGTTSGGVVSGSNGTFTVQGNHTYAVDSFDQPSGVYQVSVIIADSDGDTLTKTQTVAVVRPQLSLMVANVDIASSLVVSNVPVAVFTAPDASDAASEFAAQIDWGDGTPWDTSAVIQEVSPGLFEVLGSHTYATYDWYTMTVTISQGWQQEAPVKEGAGENGGKPIVTISDQDYKSTNTLYVAKWENAFKRLNGTTTPPQIGVNDDFIDIDPDRFEVSVDDPMAKNKQTITVHISTSSDPGGHNIVLTKLPDSEPSDGRFASTWLLLTSVKVDDEYKANGIADKAENDPTFLVKLGDTVTASYGATNATAKVPVVKVVSLHINIERNKDLADGGTPVIAKTEVEKYVDWSNQIYAQMGIRFQTPYGIQMIQAVDPPPTIVTNPLVVSAGEEYTKSEKLLLGSHRLPTNNIIQVYYVNSMQDTDGKKLAGKAYDLAGFAGTLLGAYGNSIIATNESAKPSEEGGQTLAHEIGHILLNNDDIDHVNGKVGVNQINLMASPGYSIIGAVTDSRRITSTQVSTMFETSKKLLQNP